MKETLNNTHLVSFYSIPDHCTWSVSANRHSLWSRNRIQSCFADEVNAVQRGYWLAQDHLARRWQSQTEDSDSGTVLTAALSWFWPSFRDYRKEMWPNPDCFSNLPRHFVFPINGKALTLATWNWPWLPIVCKKQFSETAISSWKRDALFLLRPPFLFTFLCARSMINFPKIGIFLRNSLSKW